MLALKDGNPNALRQLIAETLVPQIKNAADLRFSLAGEALPEIDFTPSEDAIHEQHHFIEACFCLKGAAEMWIEGRLKLLSEGEMLIIPSNLSHSPPALHCVSGSPENHSSKLLWFSPFPYGAVLSLCESRHGQHATTPRQFFLTRHVNPHFQNFVLELTAREADYQEMAKYNLLQSLIWLCRADTTTGSNISESILDDEWQTTDDNGTVKKVKEFIHQHYDAQLTLDSIARAVAVSKSKLCRIFKETMRSSVIDYLIKVRIDSSKRLLMSGLCVADAAQLVGFQDPYYFSRMFKKVTGDSPSRFKIKESLQ
jgi:AraC-like DNA-binding protein